MGANINDWDREIERLRKYEELVQFIANDYHELSLEKAQWQRDDWKRRCNKLLENDGFSDPVGLSIPGHPMEQSLEQSLDLVDVHDRF